MQIESLVKRLVREVEIAQARLDKWRSTLADNPEFAFRWQADAHKGAVVVQELTGWPAYLESAAAGADPEQAVEAFCQHAQDRLIACGRSAANKSTNVYSNVADEYKLELWAEVSRWFRHDGGM